MDRAKKKKKKKASELGRAVEIARDPTQQRQRESNRMSPETKRWTSHSDYEE